MDIQEIMTRESPLNSSNFHQVRVFQLLSSIPNLTRIVDVVVFHAGTKIVNDAVVTAGGRVLAITAYAPTLQDALEAVYMGVENVNFHGKTFRRDIAHQYVVQIFLLSLYLTNV